ncbi:rho gtpase activator [Lasallia pustulata]|uniref:Rho gtpase activator n=1 Tax=Lasallia pustulata TaxID=136370 RepID=A0A1W5CZX3_9LECA|nr:rho gtpase activator [Lasallia pustulata]
MEDITLNALTRLAEDVDAHFETLRRLGKGAFGVVDHVRSKLSQEEYARKRVYRAAAFWKDKDAIQMFENELSNLKRLEHDHLVKFVGSYTDSRYIGLLISPVADCDLKAFLTRDPFPEYDLLLMRDFIGCLCSAVNYLHENKCRHKDIKPGNILIKGQSVLLTDFGLARDFSDRSGSTTVGRSGPYTPGYASPEVVASEPRNTPSDIWSLGCVYLDIATVLKGETLRKRATFFESTGTGGSNPCKNQYALQEWLTRLESDVDNQPLKWIRLMVCEDPIQRITASSLLEMILDYSNPDSGHNYYGPCCFGGGSEADSQSYKGSSFAEENEEHEEEKEREVKGGTDAKDSDNASHEIGSSSSEVRTDKTVVSMQQAAESGAAVLLKEASKDMGMIDSKGSGVPKDVEMSPEPPVNNNLEHSSTSSSILDLPVTLSSEQLNAALSRRRFNSMGAGEYRNDSRDVAARFRDAGKAKEFRPDLRHYQFGTEEAVGEDEVSESSSAEDRSRPKSLTGRNINTLVIHESQGTKRPLLPHLLLPRFSCNFGDDKGSEIVRHSQATAPDANSEIPSPAILENLQTQYGCVKTPQTSSDESSDGVDGSSESNLASLETSLPSKRDLASWRNTFKRNTKKEEDKGKLSYGPHGVFGVPLHESIMYANLSVSLTNEPGETIIYGYIPLVVAKCGVFLKEKATDVKDVFRLSGSAGRVKQLQAQLDSPRCCYGKGVDWTAYTVHDAANVLLHYLNQLPQPVVPLSYYDRFQEPLKVHQPTEVQALDVEDFDVGKAITTYQRLITEMPPLYRYLLLYILDLLGVFASKSDLNHMTSAKLAAVFQLGMISYPCHNMSPQECRLSQDVLRFLIENRDNFSITMSGAIGADEKIANEVQRGSQHGSRVSSGEHLGPRTEGSEIGSTSTDIAPFIVPQSSDTVLSKSLNDAFLSGVHGDLPLMKDLLAQGAYLECQDEIGRTALHLAAASGNREVVQWLLDQGANPASSERFGITVGVGTTPIAIQEISTRTYLLSFATTAAIVPIVYFFFEETTNMPLECADHLLETGGWTKGAHSGKPMSARSSSATISRIKSAVTRSYHPRRGLRG